MNTQMTLDFTQAEINKRNGMHVALLNAESHGHIEEADIYFLDFLKTHDKFMAEDFKHHAIIMGMNPDNWNFLGGYIKRKARAGLIERGEMKQRSDPKSHRGWAFTWKRKLNTATSGI